MKLISFYVSESYIKCRSCSGQGCEDGDNAPLEECHHGEGSCLYSHMTVGDHVEVIRGCGEMYHGAIVEGCFDLKGWVGHGGEFVSISGLVKSYFNLLLSDEWPNVFL